LNFTEEAPRVQVFGPSPNLLPDAFGRIVFTDETAVFEDLVLKKRRRLSENDQINTCRSRMDRSASSLSLSRRVITFFAMIARSISLPRRSLPVAVDPKI
jgi:hypothetical protein